MREVSDYHKYLFYGKLTNSLTSREEEEFKELVSTDADALAYFQELTEAIPSVDKIDGYHKLAEPGFWQPLSPQLKKQERRSFKLLSIKRISVAAAILVLVVSTIVILNNNTNISHPATAARQESVELKTSDGKVINLTSLKGIINRGSLSVNNNENTLSYKSKGNVTGGVNSVSVPVGKDYLVVLADGSKVWMNSMTRLDFPSVFARDKREITVSGEAYIEVANDASRPFIVQLPRGTVKVLGTEFNVNSYDTAQIKVALVRGAVNVIAGPHALKIPIGHMGIIGSDELAEAPFNAQSVLSWRKGLFFFEESTLDEMAPVLKRWFGVDIKIDRPGIKNKKFVGALDKNKPIEEFLYHLKTISKIDAYFDKEGVLHFK